MLEIDSLPATHQREWRFAIEMEMPKVAHQPYITPVPDTRQESIHQRDSLDLAWILCCIGVRDHQADVVADNLDALIAKFAYQRVDVLRHGGLGVAIGRRRRLTGSAQVRGYDGVGVREFRHQ